MTSLEKEKYQKERLNYLWKTTYEKECFFIAPPTS